MSDITDPLTWVAKAEEDYLLARAALRRKTPLTGGACFHAQQCAEKYLKAALVARGQAFPRTHDLPTLNSLCAQVGIVLPIDPSDLGDLSDAAVQVRYPGETPTDEEAREALETARKVRRFARRRLGVR